MEIFIAVGLKFQCPLSDRLCPQLNEFVEHNAAAEAEDRGRFKK